MQLDDLIFWQIDLLFHYTIQHKIQTNIIIIIVINIIIISFKLTNLQIITYKNI